MSIESDAAKDLQLQDEDAENVVGGVKKKKKHTTREAAGSTIPSGLTPSPTGHVTPPDAEGDDTYLTGQ